MPIRKIIHIDMDAFFASVEQRNNPELRGKPVAVGGGSDRGVVAAASYEARKYGVRSAMAGKTARRLCPDLIFVRGNFPEYGKVSKQIRQIFLSYTPLVEPLSLDEAYLDVTNQDRYAVKIAKEIKERIFAETELTASAGISYNKFLAKIASDYKKPNGLFAILPEQAMEFIGALNIEKFYGIGAKTALRFKEIGVNNGADLLKLEEKYLVGNFGKAGKYFYNIARGIDEREVVPHHELKSLGAENTFDTDTLDETRMLQELQDLAKTVAERLNKKDAKGKTVTLKIKYHDFEIRSRSITYKDHLFKEWQILEAAVHLLFTPEFPKKEVRLLGITISNFYDPAVNIKESVQLKLF
jgi:DNA polymerase-4